MICEKDVTEIQELSPVWDDSCVRLCLWHLKQADDCRLAKTRTRTGPVYDVGRVVRGFPFMSADFSPNRDLGALIAAKAYIDSIVEMMGAVPLVFDERSHKFSDPACMNRNFSFDRSIDYLVHEFPSSSNGYTSNNSKRSIRLMHGKRSSRCLRVSFLEIGVAMTMEKMGKV